MKFLIKAAAACLVVATANIASAAVMVEEWRATNATNNHGLWIGNLVNKPAYSDKTYDFQNDVFLRLFDNDTATLTGTASDSGYVWDIDLTFDTPGYNGHPDGPKEGGGPALPSWIYYSNVASGTITNTTLGHIFDIEMRGPSFQIGVGANDKNGAFGASTWLTATRNGKDYKWDLNMNLSTVSEPGTIALLGLGLVGLGYVRRKRA